MPRNKKTKKKTRKKKAGKGKNRPQNGDEESGAAADAPFPSDSFAAAASPPLEQKSKGPSIDELTSAMASAYVSTTDVGSESCEGEGQGQGSGNDDPYGLKGECPICLETLPPFWEGNKRCILTCCGKWLCSKCDKENIRATCHRTIARRKAAGLIGVNRDEEVEAVLAEVNDAINCPLCRHPRGNGGLRKAMEANVAKGHMWAQYALGTVLVDTSAEEDEVDGPDWKRGVELLRASASQGYPLAEAVLGSVVHQCGIEKDLDLAKKYLERAADKGHADARYELAKIYREEDGGIDKFMMNLSRAAEEGHGEASEELTFLSECVFLERAKEGDVRAQYMLGMGLTTGTKPEEKFFEGMNWLKSASQAGHEGAKEKLDSIADYVMKNSPRVKAEHKAAIAASALWASE